MNIIGGLTSFARGVVNILLPGQPGTAIFPISNVSTKPVTTPGVYTQSASQMPDRNPILNLEETAYRVEKLTAPELNLGLNWRGVSYNPKTTLPALSTGGNTNQPSAWEEIWTELMPGLKQVINLGVGYGISKSIKSISPEQVYNPSAPYPLNQLSSVGLEDNPFSAWIKKTASEIMQPGIQAGIQGAVSQQMGVPVWLWLIGGGLILFMFLKRR
jgi:hypothetical protein